MLDFCFTLVFIKHLHVYIYGYLCQNVDADF
jgi:hypothetical protein